MKNKTRTLQVMMVLMLDLKMGVCGINVTKLESEQAEYVQIRDLFVLVAI